MDFAKLISKTSFADKSKCILEFLRKARVVDYESLQNLPIRGNFCGINAFSFVAEMNDVIKGAVQETEKVVVELEVKPKKSRVKREEEQDATST